MIETTEKKKRHGRAVRISSVIYLESQKKKKKKTTTRLTVFIESLAKRFQIEKDTKPYFKKPCGHENKNENHVGTS